MGYGYTMGFLFPTIKENQVEGGEMAHGLRALLALEEDLRSVLRALSEGSQPAVNSGSRESDVLHSGPCGHCTHIYTHRYPLTFTQTQMHEYILRNKNKLLLFAR